jgi:hypothetical protein
MPTFLMGNLVTGGGFQKQTLSICLHLVKQNSGSSCYQTPKEAISREYPSGKRTLEGSPLQTKGTKINGLCSRILTFTRPHADKVSVSSLSLQSDIASNSCGMSKTRLLGLKLPLFHHGRKKTYSGSLTLRFAAKEQLSTRYRMHCSACHQNVQDIIFYEATPA